MISQNDSLCCLREAGDNGEAADKETGDDGEISDNGATGDNGRFGIEDTDCLDVKVVGDWLDVEDEAAGLVDTKDLFSFSLSILADSSNALFWQQIRQSWLIILVWEHLAQTTTLGFERLWIKRNFY